MIGKLMKFLACSWRAQRAGWLMSLACVAGIGLPMQAWAVSTATGCFRIASLVTDVNNPYYTDPGTIAKPWDGSTDGAGQGAFPMTISINTPPFVPDGTLLGSAIAPLANLGAAGVGGYSAEQVLFRCSPEPATANALYEYYATNGDSAYAGKFDASAVSGIPGTYYTYYKGAVSRVTNITTGQVVTRYYQARALTGLDKDSQGWLLVKAKNFSQYKLDFFQCSLCTAYYADNGTNPGLWAQAQPQAYVAFVGPNITGNMVVGGDSAYIYSTWYAYWPGSINAFNTVKVRRTATCAVTNATPVVQFPPITVAELNQGGSRQLPVTIQMQCQSNTPSGMTAFTSGTAANQTALGILAQPANVQSAITAGLTTTGSGVRYLLSDNYGTDASIASGVGVALTRPNGTALNFLSNQYITTGGAKDGWDPVLNDASSSGSPGAGLTSYTRTINATFKAFAPGSTPITPGRYNATAQVIVRVQ